MSALQADIAKRKPWLVKKCEAVEPYLFRTIQVLVNGGNFAIYAYVLKVASRAAPVLVLVPGQRAACACRWPRPASSTLWT